MKKGYMTEAGAIENVKRLFQQADVDIISVQDAYKNWGRDTINIDDETNKAWLSNRLVKLKYHDLIKPIYAMKNSRKTLDKVQLTIKGKRVLGRLENSYESTKSSVAADAKNDKALTPLDLMKLIAKLREENPEYEITFDIKLKER